MPPKKKIIKVTDIVRAQPSRKDVGEESREPYKTQKEFVWDTPTQREDDFKSIFAYNHKEENQTSSHIQPSSASSRNTDARISYSRSKRRGLMWAIICVFGIIAIVGVLTLLSSVSLDVITKKVQASFEETLVVKAQGTAEGTLTIPGEIVKERKTGTFTFKPSGQKAGEEKARGTVIIYNAYGTSPQILIATTRLETPDGKIYRLADRVTVPGAKMVNGIIELASVEAQVIADGVGESYNIPPQDKFTIPGFKGTDKYDKFYAQSIAPIKIGEGIYATDEDIAQAELKAQEDMKGSLLTSLKLKIPQDFKFAEDVERMEVITKNVHKELNSENLFSIVMDAELTTFIFKESDIRDVFKKRFVVEGKLDAAYTEKEFSIEYGTSVPQWDNGTLRMPLIYKATYAMPVDVEVLKKEIAGKKEVDLKSYLLSLPYIDKLNVSFWPFWNSSVPKNTDKITINVE